MLGQLRQHAAGQNTVTESMLVSLRQRAQLPAPTCPGAHLPVRWRRAGHHAAFKAAASMLPEGQAPQHPVAVVSPRSRFRPDQGNEPPRWQAVHRLSLPRGRCHPGAPQAGDPASRQVAGRHSLPEKDREMPRKRQAGKSASRQAGKPASRRATFPPTERDRGVMQKRQAGKPASRQAGKPAVGNPSQRETEREKMN